MAKNPLPPQDLLDGVRNIAAWNHCFSAQGGKELGDERRRAHLGDKLRSIMSELEIQVSHREAKAIFREEYKLIYIVAYRGAAELEFTDLLPDKSDSGTLDSVRRYHPGEWEQRINAVYKKGLDLYNQWNAVSRLIEQLGNTSDTPEEIVGFIEATENPIETIELLILSDEWEAMSGVLHIAYAVLGRCRESKCVLDTVISIHPENPGGYLLLGCLFRHALYNANLPPRGSVSRFGKLLETTGKAGEEWLNEIDASDPYLSRCLTDRECEQEREEMVDRFSQVTLEALGCSWDFAYNRAEELFTEAMRVSRDKGTKERAWSGLSSLKMYHKPE